MPTYYIFIAVAVVLLALWWMRRSANKRARGH